MSSKYPLARKEKLVVREVADELLVYDLARNKALCLNRIAGAVWKLSDGHKSARQIAEDLSAQFDATIEESAVWHAVDQLGRDHLLEYCIAMPSSVSRMTRRQQLKSLGRAAAIAGPMITALAVPASADDSGSCIPTNKPCTPGQQCCNKNAVCSSTGAGRRPTCHT